MANMYKSPHEDERDNYALWLTDPCGSMGVIMNTELVITLLILLGVIIGFISGKFRLGLVGITGAILLCLTGVLEQSEAFAYFANGNMTMIAGMFILSGALSKTHLVPAMRSFMMKRAGKGSTIAWMYFVACMVLIQFVLPTPLIGMTLPFMAILDEDSPVQPSQLLLPGTVLAFVTQGAAPFGIGTSFYGMFNGYLESGGASVTIGVLDYGKVLIVPAIIALVYYGVIGWKRFPVRAIDSSMIGDVKDKEVTLSKGQETLVYVVFVAVVAMMILSDYTPFDINVLPAAGAVILMFAGVLDLNDVKNTINIDILFMIGGIMAVASAVQKTGAGTLLADTLVNILGGNPSGIVVLATFYYAGALLTQFMSNIATMNIFAPLAVMTAVTMGLDPRAFCLAIAAGCNAAMLTPNASPSSAVAFGAGRYKIKDVLKVNLPLWIIYGIAVMFMATRLYPLGG